MTRRDIEHVHWMAAGLQDYLLDPKDADRLAKELHSLHDFMRREAERLTFEDEPSTFRKAQDRSGDPNGK